MLELRFPVGWQRRSSCQSGFSLIEVLISATMFAIVSIGMLPIFIRSVHNNISGLDSNQATQHARADLENLLTLAIDDRRFDLSDPVEGQTVQPASTGEDGDEMLLGDLFWDQGARAQIPAEGNRACNVLVGTVPKTLDGRVDCVKLGEGDWVAASDDAKGRVLWQRRSVVRQYAYADISDGVIDQSGTELVTLGHAQLFDRPLASDAPAADSHFKEEVVELKSERSGADSEIVVARLAQTTMELGPAGHRTRMLRAF